MADRPGRVNASENAPDAEGEDWEAVAIAITDRMAARRIGQQELADRAGIAVSTLRLVQHGATRRVRTRTLTAIARALDWPDDHLVRVLTGGTSSADDRDEETAVVGRLILEGVRDIRDDLRALLRRLDDLDRQRSR
ncbi:helix-turn-helix domain-containing protein [Frankia canadensis]|nr:helix-turn-helix domain-containing protein [Frankia canadensis]